jgi:pimeloyl-ACP methyl ester carboxylesterase
VLGHSRGSMLGARLVARWPGDYAGYIGVGQVSTARGIVVTLDRLAPLIRAGAMPPISAGWRASRPKGCWTTLPMWR